MKGRIACNAERCNTYSNSVCLSGGASQNLRVPFDIYSMAKASDFKFGAQLGFAKTHQKTTPIGKVGVALG